ncbi:MAG TPA: DinB family protein [Actinomycetota bacterium]|nr:DinB family protein [Actinomycetota bacterium]
MATLLDEAFAHHAWATLRVFDALDGLGSEQLETAVPGTYGSILDTMRHIVGADCSYLFVTTRGRVSNVLEDRMDLTELRSVMERNGGAWSKLLAEGVDPTEVLARRWDDGSKTEAPIGIRLAQALHHGTDHRSQICTALTTLGIEPPLIDVWDFGEEAGSVREIAPPA